MGNPDLDFEIGISDFAIEREIRKQISLPRNPSSCWVTLSLQSAFYTQSAFYPWSAVCSPQSAFYTDRFPFYRSIEKSEKGFAKIF